MEGLKLLSLLQTVGFFFFSPFQVLSVLFTKPTDSPTNPERLGSCPLLMVALDASTSDTQTHTHYAHTPQSSSTPLTPAPTHRPPLTPCD